MLKKKMGVRETHLMCIIRLVEANFNTALKIMFAQKLMWQAEISGITPDQWGGCSNGSAPDYATRKLITWEMARHCKTLLESFFGDLASCFDRMMTKLSTIVAMKKCILRMTCHSRSTTV